jgi:probable H4MPT-linked C1 transfer pathway protein
LAHSQEPRIPANRILGLDIGGANLKAATPDRRAIQVPFALWKQPEKLPQALQELIEHFPDVTELAITMTGELCDCFETKADGVRTIVNATTTVAKARPVRVWSTAGTFVSPERAMAESLSVAAGNWHALATWLGRQHPQEWCLLVDIGSTTTDIIPIGLGTPNALGRTDMDRLIQGELLYTGVKRTPVCALMPPGEGAAEFFATMQDVYLLLGLLPENPSDTDTADGRVVTKPFAHARLSRMLCGDPVLTPESETRFLAEQLFTRQRDLLRHRIDAALQRMVSRAGVFTKPTAIISGAGEFLARLALEAFPGRWGKVVSLTDQLGPECATCAPAHAVACLAAEVGP